jgi:hypothetical protein
VLNSEYEETARRWLSRAEEVAATDALKRRYADKIDILLSAPPDEEAAPGSRSPSTSRYAASR